MLLISTTVLFLGLYISPTTPIVVTPNAPALPVPRAIPENNFCEALDVGWVRRECIPSVQLTSWRDVCEGGLMIYSSCSGSTMCDDILDELDETIKCIPLLKEGETAPREAKTDPQVGNSDKKSAVVSLEGTQLKHEVVIADDMKASVTAMFLSDDESYAVETHNVIVGKIHGKEITVCSGDQLDDAKSRLCYPKGRFDLHKGDQIDFTWGLTSGQEGMLSYAIWPSS